MAKSKRLLMLQGVLISSVGALALFVGGPRKVSYADKQTPSINFNSSKNKFTTSSEYQTGDATNILTENGSSLSFHYVNMNDYSLGWQTLGVDGSFCNIESRISGIASMTFTFAEPATGLGIYYSGNSTFTDDKIIYVSEGQTTFTTDFADFKPNYFKVENMEEVEIEITSLVVEFDCSSKYNNVQITSQNAEMGNVYSSVANGVYGNGTSLKIVPLSNEGYTFSYWENVKTHEQITTPILEFTLNNQDAEYQAVFEEANVATGNRIIIDTVGNGKNTTGKDKYYLESKVVLSGEADQGYFLAGWYDFSDNLVSNQSSFSYDVIGADVVLQLKFGESGGEVLVYSNDENLGTVAGSGNYVSGSKVTITATPKGTTNYFLGWYRDEAFDYSIISTQSFTFTMPKSSEPLRFYAYFVDYNDKVIWDKAHGVRPVLSTDQKTVTYGFYPSTRVTNQDDISEMVTLPKDPSFGGTYFYKGEYYCTVDAQLFVSNSVFLDGTKATRGKTYFFKLEPITWNVISTYEEESVTNFRLESQYLILPYRYSDQYEGTQPRWRYDEPKGHLKEVYSNNYIYSGLRDYLNQYFVNLIFPEHSTINCLVNEKVWHGKSTTDVDDYGNNAYAVEEYTYDKIYLPSFQDINLGTYSSRKLVSDYALARGACTCMREGVNLHYGSFYTRSPASGKSYYAFAVDYAFGIEPVQVGRNYYSCAPCITIHF